MSIAPPVQYGQIVMSDDDFLSRWSRRKRAVAEEAPKVVEEDPAPAPEPVPETAEEEAELLTRLELPVPEDMKPGDDFSAFMADGVPAFLRKRALRVLWRSNPVLANLDGLNDYDEDFTSPELTQKVLATAYQVGRGFVTEKPSEAEASDPPETTDEEAEVPVQEEENPDIVAENQSVSETLEVEEEMEPAPRPRRMRFET